MLDSLLKSGILTQASDWSEVRSDQVLYEFLQRNLVGVTNEWKDQACSDSSAIRVMVCWVTLSLSFISLFVFMPLLQRLGHGIHQITESVMLVKEVAGEALRARNVPSLVNG